MLEHEKVIWLIRTFCLRNQRHCTHILYCNMKRSFDWSEDSSWEIRGTALTSYVRTWKGHLTDQNILSDKSEALHSHPMLDMQMSFDWSEHSSWEIRGIALTPYVGTCKGHLTSLLRNQRHCTHNLCWNIKRSFNWSEHSSWEIRDTALTYYIGTYKGHLTDQNILSDKSETMHSQTMLGHTKVIWLVKNAIDKYIKNTYWLDI